MKITDEEFETMANVFGYKGLPGRWKVLEEYFDIQEGSTVIDGGAFHGDMAYYFSKKVGDKGKVLSFEPSIGNFRVLYGFKERHNLDNVHLLPVALWDKRESLKFYHSNYSNAGSLLKEFRKVDENQYENVMADSLDNILNRMNVDKVDYIWTNIEAAEEKALRGMEKTLKNNKCKVCISTHRVKDEEYTTKGVEDILKEYGYKVKAVEGHERWIYGEA